MYKLDFLFLVENANLRGGTEIQTINITHALIEANYRARVLSVVPYSGDDDVILSFDLKSYRIYEKWKKMICVRKDFLMLVWLNYYEYS